jgi:predicted nuclease of predicted toxin-antitoxin system
MRVLLDACVPRPLRRFLPDHSVKAAPEMGWGQLKNGDLLKAAEQQFDVFVTADKNLKRQQNLLAVRIAILIVPTNNWPTLRQMGPQVAVALANIKPGEYVELQAP